MRRARGGLRIRECRGTFDGGGFENREYEVDGSERSGHAGFIIGSIKRVAREVLAIGR